MYRISAPLAWRSNKLEAERKKGIVESFTKVWSSPNGFEHKVPYTLALIMLDNGPKIFSEIVDSRDIKIGMNVESCVRKVYTDGNEGIISYGVKFRVVK